MHAFHNHAFLKVFHQGRIGLLSQSIRNFYTGQSNKKSPANAKGSARQRCMCEGPVRTKSKLTTMFHLDSTKNDA